MKNLKGAEQLVVEDGTRPSQEQAGTRGFRSFDPSSTFVRHQPHPSFRAAQHFYQ